MSSQNTLRFKVEYQDFREVYIRLRLLIKPFVGGRKCALQNGIITHFKRILTLKKAT